MSSNIANKLRFYNQLDWSQVRPTNLSTKTKTIISIVAVATYIVTFPFVIRSLGPAGSALLVVPVAVIAYLWGLRIGLVAGLVASPINALLFNLIGSPITIRGGVSGAITVILVGVVLGWLSDLLERIYQQSQQLAVARDQALEANRLKTILLSKVSHELRTPLSAILGYGELLAEGTYGPVTQQQHQKLCDIVHSAQDLEILVSDLLDMSQIEADQLKLFPKPFVVADLVEMVVSQTAVSAQKKGLHLTCTISPTMPVILIADRTRISQILSNLITNAIKYTNEGSIQVNIYAQQDTHWVMQVTDTGIGVNPEEQAHIFDSFRQGQTDDAPSGIGLGLAIVKELVTRMNGEIQVDSSVGQGSCFTVILPLTLPTMEKHQ